VEEDPETNEIILRYPGGRKHEESAPGQGPLQQERFDLLVLAVGIRPPAKAVEIASTLGIELNEYGFCETDKFSPLATTRPGVFVCGAFASPKEIAETIVDASGAAAEVMRLLRENLGQRKFNTSKPFISESVIPEKPINDGETPEIAIALCGCAGEISRVVDLERVAAFAGTLTGVTGVEIFSLACFNPDQDKLRQFIKESSHGSRARARGSPHIQGRARARARRARNWRRLERYDCRPCDC
jgi:heterodisulfide reductase subunit A